MWYIIGALLAAFLFWGWSLCRTVAKACPAPPNCDEKGLYDDCGEVYNQTIQDTKV